MIRKIFLHTAMVSLLAFGAAAVADEQIAKECMDCHGKDGVSTDDDVPTIAGYSAVYISDALASYAEGERPATESKYRHGDTARPATDMGKIAKELDEAKMKSVAEFFAARKFVPAKQQFDADKAAKGAEFHDEECSRCHDEGGSIPDDDAGILAGQWMPYLRHTFEEYASGKRRMPEKMKPRMEKLDAATTEALINYYGSLQ